MTVSLSSSGRYIHVHSALAPRYRADITVTFRTVIYSRATSPR